MTRWQLLGGDRAGMTGVLGNIDASGAPSMAFHLYPFMLEYDPHTGDHGLGFFGHAMNVGAYSLSHPTRGWLCYLCAYSTPNASNAAGAPAGPSAKWATSGAYALVPLDSFRRRAYLGELGLWMVVTSAHEIVRLEVEVSMHSRLRTACPVTTPLRGLPTSSTALPWAPHH